MKALRKQEVMEEFDELIESLSKDEEKEIIIKLMGIKEKVEKLLQQQDEVLYNGIVNNSMKEIWDNEKDAIYDNL